MEERKFPKEIMIEATNCCNNKCFFCGSTVSNRRKGYMDAELMQRLILEGYENGARKISFHGMGEPCLCEELSTYVGLAKKIGYTYIYLDTNGILATPEVIFPVIESGLDSLKFSIHAATAETYKKITDNDAFKSVVDNLKKTSDFIKETGMNCKLIAYFAESTLNSGEADIFKQTFEPYVNEVWITPIHNASGAKEENILYSINNDVSAMRALPCSDLKRMIINWEGNAIACCTDWTDALVYGSVYESSLKELWNCETINRIREEQKRVDTLRDICKKCMGIPQE